MKRFSSEVAEPLRQFAKGELTWAEVEGMTAEQAHEIASLACELAGAGRWEDARVLLEGLIALNPRDAAVQAALGTVYQKLGRSRDAWAAYDAALGENPRQAVALANRGELRLASGDAGGYADLIAAIAADPEGTSSASRRAQGLAKAMALAAAGSFKRSTRS